MTDDATKGRIELDARFLPERFREQLAEPVFFDLRGEREQDLALFVAAFDLANFGGHEQTRAVHGAFAREHAAPAVDEGATQRSRIQPHRDLIGKAREDATLDRSGLDLAGLQIKALVAGDGEKLLGQLRGLARGAGVDPEPRATLRIEAAVFRVAKRAHQDEKVRFRVAAEHIFAVFARLFALEAAQEIAALGERRDQRDGGHAAILLRGQKHARVARVDRERQHAPAERRDRTRDVPSAAVERAEIDEELFGARERLRIGRFQPAEAADFFDAARFQGENDFGEIEPFHLGQFLRRRDRDARAPSKAAGNGRARSGRRGRRVGRRRRG